MGSNDIKNVIIAFPLHMHCTAGILDLVLDDVIMLSAVELSDRGAVTRKVVQNTRPSFSHVRRGAGHKTMTLHGKCLTMPVSNAVLNYMNHMMCDQVNEFFGIYKDNIKAKLLHK